MHDNYYFKLIGKYGWKILNTVFLLFFSCYRYRTVTIPLPFGGHRSLTLLNVIDDFNLIMRKFTAKKYHSWHEHFPFRPRPFAFHRIPPLGYPLSYRGHCFERVQRHWTTLKRNQTECGWNANGRGRKRNDIFTVRQNIFSYRNFRTLRIEF